MHLQFQKKQNKLFFMVVPYYDDADVDLTKLSVQSSLKYLTTEISVIVLMQTIIQNHFTNKN